MSTPKFQGLDDLLQKNPQARSYFDTLPGYVQEMIRERANHVRSEDILHRYAENLVQGDK